MRHSGRRGETRVALILWSAKLSPVQLASLVAFKITRPPWYPLSRPPSPPTFPALFLVLSDPTTPTTRYAYQISYKGPNKYLRPLCTPHIITLTTHHISEEIHSPLSKKKKKSPANWTECNWVVADWLVADWLCLSSVCSYDRITRGCIKTIFIANFHFLVC